MEKVAAGNYHNNKISLFLWNDQAYFRVDEDYEIDIECSR